MDQDINGATKSNKNKAIFLGFLQYGGMKYLNRIYERGKPTYEIIGKKRSIIDTALTNDIRRVTNFKVVPSILGANAQTCHKIIELKIETKLEIKKTTKEPIKKFKHCTAEALVRVKDEVAKKCRSLRLLRGDRLPSTYTYKVIRRIYENAKVKYIGYRKGGRKTAPLPIAIRTIQAKRNTTNALIEREL